MPFCQKGEIRIRYEEVGSGFPLLVTPGGGLNSRVSNWPTAAINAMEEFKNDFRVITMDQRNANGGESTGPLAIDDPWGGFADDQLAVMDHLGIRDFFYMGYCIGGCFAGKLLERAPQRIVAAVFHPRAQLALPDVGVNPTRAGILRLLPVARIKESREGGEPMATLHAATLRGIRPWKWSDHLSAELIDELPVLAVAATQISGRTVSAPWSPTRTRVIQATV